MGDVLIGKCDNCGKDSQVLTKTNFFYPIPCECCSPAHFNTVCTCKKCAPVEPLYTSVRFLTTDLRDPIRLGMSLIMAASQDEKNKLIDIISANPQIKWPDILVRYLMLGIYK